MKKCWEFFQRLFIAEPLHQKDQNTGHFIGWCLQTRGTFWVEISWPGPVLRRLTCDPDFQGSLIWLCPASLYGVGEPPRLELCLYRVVRHIGPRHCHLLMENEACSINSHISFNTVFRLSHSGQCSSWSCWHFCLKELSRESLNAVICNGRFVSNVHLWRKIRFSLRDQQNERHKY